MKQSRKVEMSLLGEKSLGKIGKWILGTVLKFIWAAHLKNCLEILKRDAKMKDNWKHFKTHAQYIWNLNI